MNDLVSILTPTYNTEKFIRSTIESAQNQTYTNWECIVVDDGSTDNTCQVVSDYISKDNRFQFYNRPKDLLKGPNSCRTILKCSYRLWYSIFLCQRT